MKIYLLRHAEAVELGTTGAEIDFERRLTDKGRQQARDAGRGAARLGLTFDCVISSPAPRARQTAELFCAELQIENRLIDCEALWTGELETLFELARGRKCASVCLVGHEPILGDLIGWLITRRGEASVPLKKGGLAYLDADELPPRQPGVLRWVLTAKQLQLIAGQTGGG